MTELIIAVIVGLAVYFIAKVLLDKLFSEIVWRWDSEKIAYFIATIIGISIAFVSC